MSSLSLRSMALRRTLLRPAINTRPLNAFQSRAYADDNPSRGSTTRGEPGATTNIRSTPSANPESSSVNASRGAERNAEGGAGGSPDTASVQSPVSNPQESGLGGQEEPQGSHEKIKNDPSEPDHVKRSRVESEGQKPLDPADK